MASPQIDRIAESAFVKIASPAVTTVLAAVVIGFGGRFIDRLDHMETLLVATQTDRATMELRLKGLEGQSSDHGAAIARQSDKVLMLEFKVEDLQRNPPGSKR